MAGALQRRMPFFARRPDTQQIAMAALWETALKYHHLPPAQFDAMASVRIRGAILDDNRQYDLLPRRNRSRFGGEKLRLIYLGELLDSAAASDKAPDYFAERVLAPHATVPSAEADIDTARRSRQFDAAVRGLADERERYIVHATLRGRPHKDIAADLNISQPRASQILKRAIGRLRAILVEVATGAASRA